MFRNNDKGITVTQKTVYNYSALVVNGDPSGFQNRSGKPIHTDTAALGQQ